MMADLIIQLHRKDPKDNNYKKVNRKTTPFSIPSRVPQGSLLSPILFILFLAPLYKTLKPLTSKITISFTDDINFLAFAKDQKTCVKTLKKTWEITSQ